MISTELKVLDVGCGKRKRRNAVGIDINPRSDADVLHDLDTVPYPFPDNHFDEVYADNVIEHLDDVMKVMEELHRVTKPNGLIEVIVPFYAHRNANTDPTHKHWFGVHSFDYFVRGTDHGNFEYSPVKFTLQLVEFNKGIQHLRWFDSALTRLANNRKDFYENRLANIFPMAQLTFQLIVVK